MNLTFFFAFCTILSAMCACTDAPSGQHAPPSSDSAEEPLHYPEEVHLANVRQLTFGGNNAEAYWNMAGDRLVFQSDNPRWGLGCDQIFLMDPAAPGDSATRRMISTGRGRTTCAWFMPGDSTILFASTHLDADSCPAPPEHGDTYAWPLYSSYDLFASDLSGRIIRRLTDSPRYDAEATVSPRGDRIVFTSLRSGDLELYTMKPDGSDVRQITHSEGYDGGACFSPDGTRLVWRASRPQTEEEKKAYRELLARDLVEPTRLEIWVANADGSDARQVTHLGKANWAPTFTPDGQHILFCSNYRSERGFPFNLYRVDLDGKNLAQITFDGTFDSFPMFSPDGKQLVWCSNRHNGRTRDTNVFIADWVD